MSVPASEHPWLAQVERFPPTRYQGSKRKLLPWLLGHLAAVPCTTVLDPFSGTGAVAYGLKALGKAVVARDILESNRRIAAALVANDDTRLAQGEAAALLERVPGRRYGDVVERTFAGVYYLDEENRQLDVLAGNLAAMPPGPARAMASFAVFQACLIKRPYNLFHRRNLSLRTADVERSFGNKTTWERPFAELLPRFARQASRAVFRGAQPCRAEVGDVLGGDAGRDGTFDLVYLDPPYVPRRGAGVDYLGFYHFLEGLCGYEQWPQRVDPTSKNLRIRGAPSPWADRHQVRELLRRVYARHPRAALALSYRSDGVPDPGELLADLRDVRGEVTVHDAGGYQYALSSNRRSRELLFIAG